MFRKYVFPTVLMMNKEVLSVLAPQREGFMGIWVYLVLMNNFIFLPFSPRF